LRQVVSEENKKFGKGKKNMLQGIALTAKPRCGAVFPAVIHLVDF
jgi:hypothetical protein